MSKDKRLKQPIVRNEYSPQPFFAIGVGLFVATALFLRIYLPYDDIFGGEWIKFAGGDSYYYMRLVDNLVHNFPHLMTTDPYMLYPDGQSISSYYLFARLLGGISWLIGFGNPTLKMIDIVCAYIPAIFGALAVVVVYFVGKELANRWVGLFSCGLVAILPGEFLGRSILGFTDHHVAEILFSTIAILFLIKALKITTRETTKQIVYSIIAGIFLGLYLLTWIGGLLFVFIISLYLLIQFVVIHFKGESVKYLTMVSACCLITASVMYLPTVRQLYYIAPMLGALCMPLFLGGLSYFMIKKSMKRQYYPLVIVGIISVGIGVLCISGSSLLSDIVSRFSVFALTNTQVTTIEMQPLLFPNGTFTLALIWGNFGLSFFVALVALLVLLYKTIKSGDSIKTLIILWTVVTLTITLGQRRFAYYLVVNVSLLAGYMLWVALKWVNLRELYSYIQTKKIKYKRIRDAFVVGVIKLSLFAVLLFVLIIPVIPSTIAVASHALYAPSDAWCRSLEWLYSNSPEPFGSSNTYYDYVYNDGKQLNPTYAVTAWWDYGYWITRIAHRVPNSNPGQITTTQTDVATFFTSQDEILASNLGQGLGTEYVMIDYDTVAGKYWAIARFAGKDECQYRDIYYVNDGKQLIPVQLYYPEYYHSLSTRLYNFDGEAVKPSVVIVISSEVRKDSTGKEFKLITDAKQFNNFDDATLYITTQGTGNHLVVGDNPFVSPVPLNAVECYKLVYESSEKKIVSDVREISEVKIFKYEG